MHLWKQPATLETLCVRSCVGVLEAACSAPGGGGCQLVRWARACVPGPVRQRLLEVVLEGGRLHRAAQLGVLEALLAPDVRRLAVHHVRRLLRVRLLRLLSSGRAAGLRVLLLEDVCWLPGSPAVSSPLAAALRALPQLRQVSLRHVADDGLLRALGASCPYLQELDVEGSVGVSDLGIQKLCLQEDKPLAAGCWGPLRAALRRLFLDWFLRDALSGDTALPGWWRAAVLRCARKTACCASLRLVHLARCPRVTARGLGLLRACAPGARTALP